MTARIELTRLDLMGVGKLESERTASERRLAAIVFCAPLERSFDGRRDELELWRLQQRFFEQRRRFITTMDERRLRALAAALLKNDRTLSSRQTGLT